MIENGWGWHPNPGMCPTCGEERKMPACDTDAHCYNPDCADSWNAKCPECGAKVVYTRGPLFEDVMGMYCPKCGWYPPPQLRAWCGACGSKMFRYGDSWRCPNPDCKSRQP